MVLGVDGCKEGWVAIQLDRHGRFTSAMAGRSLLQLLELVPDLSTAAVDMPLHLLDAARRPADLEARRRLGAARGRSVFPALPRFALDDGWIDRGYDVVNSKCRARYGSGISRQSFSLRRKTAEVNGASALGLPVIEVHPELSFAAMNGDRPLTFAKKCWGGQRERLVLLRRQGIALPDNLPEGLNRLAPDDIIDAAACAWSAHRHSNGVARKIPAVSPDPAEPRIWT